MRFNRIADGAQRGLEDAPLAWTRRMQARHGGEHPALGGGVCINAFVGGRRRGYARKAKRARRRSTNSSGRSGDSATQPFSVASHTTPSVLVR